MITLHPYQRPGLEQFLARPDKRFLFAWGLGAGKTYGALAAVQELKAKRALFIVPAIVRPNWTRLINKFFPDIVLGSITMGRNTVGSKKAIAARDSAYAADYQIVSYDLSGEIDLTPWDIIVLDEVHNLRSATSIQSKNVRAIARANPKCAMLGLSGTLIPNEAWQLWNVLDTFYPGQWGKPAKIGTKYDVSWAFKEKYCKMEIRHGHPYFYGLRPEMRAYLENELRGVTNRVVQSDFMGYLPPLFVESIPGNGRVDKLVSEWSAQLGEEVTHWGVFTHLRDTADAIGAALRKKFGDVVNVITGADSPEKRARLLAQSSEAPRAIIVGTTHALNEGISLSFCKAALIVEWTTAMAEVLQFIGRFARQDSATMASTRVDFVVKPEDESRMGVLRERISAFNSLFRADRAETLAGSVFAERTLSAAKFAERLELLVADLNTRADYVGLIEEDDDADD